MIRLLKIGSLKPMFGAVLMTALILGSCEKYDDEYYAKQATISCSSPYFTATTDGGTIHFPDEGGTAEINVDCNADLNLSVSNNSFCKISRDGNTITITADLNSKETERSGDFTIRIGGYDIASIDVIQDAYSTGEISIEPDTWNFPALSELTAELAVTSSSASWEVTCSSKWLTATKTSDTVLTLTATENNSKSSRSTTVSFAVKNETKKIEITQDGIAYISTTDDAISFTGTGGTYEIAVSASHENVEYSSDDNWISMTYSDGTLTVTAEPNESESERGTTIYLKTGDGIGNEDETQIAVTQWRKDYSMILSCTIPNDKTSMKLGIGLIGVLDWGDGSNPKILTGTETSYPSHTYSTAGTYEISINASLASFSDPSSTYYLTEIVQWGNLGEIRTPNRVSYGLCKVFPNVKYLPADYAGFFSQMTSMENVFNDMNITEVSPDLFKCCQQVESFSQVFYGCSSLKTVPTGLFDNCTAATDFSSAFASCTSLTTIESGAFNCPATTTMTKTFDGCKALQTIQDDAFDCPNVTTAFSKIFSNCTALKTIGSRAFKFSSVTDFSSAFNGFTKLETIGSKAFVCPSATTFSKALYKCTALKAIGSEAFVCPNATDFSYVFSGCTALAAIPSVLFANCTAATDFSYAFYNCSALTAIPSGLFDNCIVATDFSSAFASCTSLTTIESEAFNCPAATTLANTFYGCTALETIQDDAFDCPNVTTAFYKIFSNCTALKTIGSRAFKFSRITDFSSAFKGFTKLETIGSEAFVCPSATTFSEAFYECTALTTISSGLFDKCTAVTDFSSVFYKCTALTSIPSKLFANSAATDFSYAFYNCSALTSIPSGLFDNCTAATNFDDAFYKCTALTSIPSKLFRNLGEHSISLEATFRECTSLTSIPTDMFDGVDISCCRQTFNGDSALTGESPYTETDGVKEHLYERAYFAKILDTAYHYCFTGCTGLTDYDDIPYGWK